MRPASAPARSITLCTALLLLVGGPLLAARGAHAACADPGAAELVAPDQFVELRMSGGTIRLGLITSVAPATVAQFLANVESGLYDGSIIHASHPTESPAQDPLAGWIEGGEWRMAVGNDEFEPIPVGDTTPEEACLSNKRGTIATLLTTGNSSQWFINAGDNSADFDGAGYTVFGRVVDPLGVPIPDENPLGLTLEIADSESVDTYITIDSQWRQFLRFLPVWSQPVASRPECFPTSGVNDLAVPGNAAGAIALYESGPDEGELVVLSVTADIPACLDLLPEPLPATPSQFACQEVVDPQVFYFYNGFNRCGIADVGDPFCFVPAQGGGFASILGECAYAASAEILLSDRRQDLSPQVYSSAIVINDAVVVPEPEALLLAAASLASLAGLKRARSRSGAQRRD